MWLRPATRLLGGLDYDAICAGCATSSTELEEAASGLGSFGEVAAVGHLRFVVGLDQDGAGEAEQGWRVGDDADDVGAPLDSPC